MSANSPLPRARIAAIAGTAIALVGLAAAAYFLRREPRPAPPPMIPEPSAAPEGLARRVAEVLHAQRDTLKLTPVPEKTVYLALRKQGVRLGDGWFSGPDWPRAVLQGITHLSAAGTQASQADTVELCLPHSRKAVRLRAGRPPLGDMHRGVLGLSLAHRDVVSQHCPTQTIANNLSFKQLASDFARAQGLTEEALADQGAAEQFSAYQLLVRIDERKLERMVRGNEVVALSEVTTDRIERLAAGMTRWMKTQVQPDGRMVYMYFPSSGEESRNNNMIRQFMATLCLQRIAKREDTEEARELALRNLRYNLSQFYLRDGQLGLIDERGKRKLGAAALAALAIVESPFREQFTEHELSLRRLVEHMQQPDGSFHTFYGTDRNDNQNFYPGEALLLWASLLKEEPNSPLAERFAHAFRYYRSWHRDNRNPAFIPWHTQAYFMVWQRTRDPELRDFMFEMNDFLADFQDWEGAPYDDLRGRFYDPDRRSFGPPHASSTGVYLEGLVDARILARTESDASRAQRYGRVIKRALRSLMQLQFESPIDTFYISKKDRVLGGVRTNEYDNAIRVDNVQHSLMGLQKLLDDIQAGHPL